jgi:hypothetical protein
MGPGLCNIPLAAAASVQELAMPIPVHLGCTWGAADLSLPPTRPAAWLQLGGGWAGQSLERNKDGQRALAGTGASLKGQRERPTNSPSGALRRSESPQAASYLPAGRFFPFPTHFGRTCATPDKDPHPPAPLASAPWPARTARAASLSRLPALQLGRPFGAGRRGSFSGAAKTDNALWKRQVRQQWGNKCSQERVSGGFGLCKQLLVAAALVQKLAMPVPANIGCTCKAREASLSHPPALRLGSSSGGWAGGNASRTATPAANVRWQGERCGQVGIPPELRQRRPVCFGCERRPKE